MSVVIAVDGTAASGKGTLARKLAKYFGFAHLDSGSLYRLTAFGVISAKGDPSNESDALAAARAINPADADMPDIRTQAVGEAASIVAAIPAVRTALLDFQRAFARKPPGAVIDGRDVGTVVCPNAPAKLFIDASPEARAHRRWLELAGKGEKIAEAAVLAELVARDERDRNRSVAPLKPADDADLLDTTHLGIEPAFAAALALVEPRIRALLQATPRG